MSIFLYLFFFFRLNWMLGSAAVGTLSLGRALALTSILRLVFVIVVVIMKSFSFDLIFKGHCCFCCLCGEFQH